MKYLLSILLIISTGFYPAEKENCNSCGKQDWDYICAGNTLSMNFRLCMDISEVSGLMYKVFLQDMREQHGIESDEYLSNLPDFRKWESLFPGKTAARLSTQYFDTDDFALAPMMGVTYEQAVRFCDWRTQQFKEELAKMDPEERAQFPKDFKFRLPTAKEWARIRFMKQEKGLIKSIQKITASTTKSYGIKKNSLINDNPKMNHVFAVMSPKLAMYNLFGNVAEMTAEKGVAMGGSWNKKNTGKDFEKEFLYQGPEAWLGFRCIFEILR
jgi:formylglycine-generating enzyme required for sulfatase activity